MADTPGDDELLLDQQDEGNEADEEQEGEQGSNEAGDEAEEELEVTFGDEAAPASGERETGLVKHLREVARDQARRISELEKAKPQSERIVVGERPTLEGCEYDEDKFIADTEAWVERKRLAEQGQSAADQEQREAQQEWQGHLTNYQSRRAELKFADVDDAEELARARLDQVQQAAIVVAADNPALVLYSLGKHPAKLAELSQIKNPLKLAAAVAKLEGTLKVTARRKAPDPEEIASGTASVAQRGTDKTLERLEKEALRSGDRTKLIQYKASLKTPAK
jgi:hypothetical protein